MKFYSEKMNKLFDTQEDLEKAETEYTERKERERKEREERNATEKARFEEVKEAYSNYRKLAKKFVDDYGYGISLFSPWW